jgi:hypothetical protein
MLFDGFVGGDQAKRQLERAVACGREGHAYIIEGMPGVGKRAFARMLAGGLICRGAGGKAVRPLSRLAGKWKTAPTRFCCDRRRRGSITVDTIRKMRDDICIFPNDSRSRSI